MMGLSNIQSDIIGKYLEIILKSLPIFSNYKLIGKNIQKLNSPTIITNYDFTFQSEEHNRWLFIRLQDLFSHQNLVLWVNQLNNKKNVNLDIKNYFISELNNKAIKQKMSFKIHSEKDLEIELKETFKYINEHIDDKLKKVLLGNIWIDMPMDWGDYK